MLDSVENCTRWTLSNNFFKSWITKEPSKIFSSNKIQIIDKGLALYILIVEIVDYFQLSNGGR